MAAFPKNLGGTDGNGSWECENGSRECGNEGWEWELEMWEWELEMQAGNGRMRTGNPGMRVGNVGIGAGNGGWECDSQSPRGPALGFWGMATNLGKAKPQSRDRNPEGSEPFLGNPSTSLHPWLLWGAHPSLLLSFPLGKVLAAPGEKIPEQGIGILGDVPMGAGPGRGREVLMWEFGNSEGISGFLSFEKD